MTRGRLLAGCLAALVLSGCAQPTFETADELYEAAGGESWCGGGLSLTVAPWVGKCGPAEDQVVIGIAVTPGELRSSLGAADDKLLVLVPDDPDRLPGWQLRTQQRERLEAAQELIGGVILDDEDAISAWLGEDDTADEA